MNLLCTKIKQAMIPVITAASLLLSGCGISTNQNTSRNKTGMYFDTVITITLYGNDAKNDTYFDGCFALASKYESYLSTTIASSDISKINSNPGTPVKVHPETADVIKQGLKYSESSDGLFDITIGKLTDLWDISDASQKDHKGTPPSSDDISSLVGHVNYHNVSVDGDTVTLSDPEAAIDLGGIAKGYIADQMKAYLEKHSVRHAIINLGGNVLVLGEKPDNTDYTIGIQKPFDEDGDPICAVDLKNQSAVTSGTYQRYFKYNGKIYHHILNPKTGYPEDNGLSSVTIITASSTEADALSTTVFLMGREAGMQYIEGLDGVEAIFIDDQNKITYTSGIGKTIPYQKIR